jgi:hypothetical protein
VPDIDLTTFNSCPIESRFIDTREHALSYYAHKLIGDHKVTVKGVPITVRFNAEEIHHFTDERSPCPPSDVVKREGKSGEVRCFARDRARNMDGVLDALRRAAVVHAAKIPGGRVVYGPAGANAQRLAVVIGPGGGNVWFVRTVFNVSAQSFASACRSAKPAPWPPK